MADDKKAMKLDLRAYELVRQLAFAKRRPQTECLAEAVEQWAARQPETKTLGLKVGSETEGT